MFRMLRERRQRREREAAERRAKLRHKAAPLESLRPGEPFPDGVAMSFADVLIAQAEQDGSHRHTVSDADW